MIVAKHDTNSQILFVSHPYGKGMIVDQQLFVDVFLNGITHPLYLWLNGPNPNLGIKEACAICLYDDLDILSQAET